MLFNSLQFALFFPIVTILYFLCPHGKRWLLLLTASCLFYMAFIPYYIAILFVTIIIDYLAGIYIERETNPKRRKLYLIISILSTCLVLFVFKYYNFFIGNINEVAHLFHWNYSVKILNIILPIGLSFHTFQSLSYVIEVYRSKQKAEKHFGIYALYVMFYPQLVAGPIERPQNVLHQFYEIHTIDYKRISGGLKLMAWGLFKKVIIADRLAKMVNHVYGDVHHFSGSALIVSAIFFAFQIYCDFSGYSDIAIGSAQVMGFRLMTNFNKPYFARSISEFWKRWHISLSTWFRDYLYIPLGGNRVGKSRWYFNLFITFLVSGFWHGANWTFVIWGGLHGAFLVLSILNEKTRNGFNKALNLVKHPRLLRAIDAIIVFVLVDFAWIFFRANNLSDAKYVITHLFSFNFSHGVANALKGNMYKAGMQPVEFLCSVFLILFLLFFESQEHSSRDFEIVNKRPVYVRWAIYYLVLLAIMFYGVFDNSQFIYFQF